jgi:hypothetical protein
MFSPIEAYFAARSASCLSEAIIISTGGVVTTTSNWFSDISQQGLIKAT